MENETVGLAIQVVNIKKYRDKLDPFVQCAVDIIVEELKRQKEEIKSLNRQLNFERGEDE